MARTLRTLHLMDASSMKPSDLGDIGKNNRSPVIAQMGFDAYGPREDRCADNSRAVSPYPPHQKRSPLNLPHSQFHHQVAVGIYVGRSDRKKGERREPETKTRLYRKSHVDRYDCAVLVIAIFKKSWHIIS